MTGRSPDAGLRILTPARYRQMPWANGRGITTELARGPAGDGPFDWRVSIAGVDADGPFSRFPGVDRTLVVIEGNGIRLEHAPGGEGATLGRLEPYFFSGDFETIGRLVDGPIRDFNVMTRRGASTHRVEVIPSAARARFDAGEGLALVYGLAAGGTIRCGERAATLEAGETALLPAPAGAIEIEPAGDDAVFLAVAIEAIANR